PGTAAVAAIVVAAFGAARLTMREHPEVRIVLDGVSLAALAYLEALSLSGLPLVLAWSLTAGTLAEASRRLGDRLAGWGGAAFVLLALGHELAFEAPPDALVYGSGDL